MTMIIESSEEEEVVEEEEEEIARGGDGGGGGGESTASEIRLGCSKCRYRGKEFKIFFCYICVYLYVNLTSIFSSPLTLVPLWC